MNARAPALVARLGRPDFAVAPCPFTSSRNLADFAQNIRRKIQGFRSNIRPLSSKGFSVAQVWFRMNHDLRLRQSFDGRLER